MNLSNYGMNGQEDAFLCLTQACRQRRGRRREARQQEKEERQAAKELKETQRARQKELRLEKKALKNDALRAENERNRVETLTLQSVTQTPLPMPPVEKPSRPFGPLPPWAVAAGVGALLLIGVLGKK